MPYLILAVIALALIVLAIKYWYFTLLLALIIVAIIAVPKIVRGIRKNRYFWSEDFLQRKEAVRRIVAEHNDIKNYVSYLRSGASYTIGSSASGQQSHLASFENTSSHNYKRDRNVADYAASNVHNCSLQVVRGAKADPIKYLIKYFHIPVSEDSVRSVEDFGESIARLENAIANLAAREVGLTRSFNPPAFVLKYYASEFMEQVGVQLSKVTVPYPNYKFEYVSAGGNSSQQTFIEMNGEVTDALIETLSARIKFRDSAAGQRALMTARLRNSIKERDGFACKACGLSTKDEPNLLLEIDHIVPVSRGGLSIVENLQTLCWRCNRSKSNKVA